MEATITKRLKQVLIAAADVPRHREIMRQAGYDPRCNFSGVADLAIFPVMTKADLKRAPDDFLQVGAPNHLDKYFRDRTSGSTGIPLAVYRSPSERFIHVAKWLRVLMLNGYRPTDKVFSFTASGRLSAGRSRLQRFGLLRRNAVDITLSSKESADELLQYRPDVVYGVRTSLLMVAEELARRGIKAPPIKLLIAGGEVIDAQTRRRCREIFDIDITETYGTVEMGVMAFQRAGETVLSLIEDCTYFEFLDAQGRPVGPGQPGRLVVTDLHGGLMPFIRYDQGDLATYSLRRTEKGETVRVIDRIFGRQDDLATLPDGSFLTYLDFYELMDAYPGIERFRVRQRAPDMFTLEMVSSTDYFRGVERDLVVKLQTLSHLPLHFEIHQVNNIPPDPSGKMRMLVSEVGR
jgi:phenylacetate-CoA ligase